MQDRAHAGGAVFQDAGILARLIDQLRECLEARVLAHANKERIEARDRNPFEIFDDFVVYVPGERAMRGVRTGNDQQGVTVRLAARHSLRGEAAGDAGLGLDDDRLPKPFRHLVSKKPADDVHVPSGREAMHELDRTIRIIRRRRRAADRDQPDERGDDCSGHCSSLAVGSWTSRSSITACAPACATGSSASGSERRLRCRLAGRYGNPWPRWPNRRRRGDRAAASRRSG